jgi:[ribosomal protein S18]-alanine N-acetyltransferase
VSGVLIRAMDPDDVPAVCAVDRECMQPPWSQQAFAAECKSTAGYYRVAELDGEVVGYLGATMILDEAHITTFGVRTDARRRGIGERLLADTLREAIRRKVRRVTLEVREGNTPALALYRKYGFAPVSRRTRYYADDEDAVVMWVDDTARAAFRENLKARLGALGL